MLTQHQAGQKQRSTKESSGESLPSLASMPCAFREGAHVLLGMCERLARYIDVCSANL
jgi:hypothetical protein